MAHQSTRHQQINKDWKRTIHSEKAQGETGTRYTLEGVDTWEHSWSKVDITRQRQQH